MTLSKIKKLSNEIKTSKEAMKSDECDNPSFRYWYRKGRYHGLRDAKKIIKNG